MIQEQASQRSGLTGVLRRRWYIVLAGVALTLGLCVEAMNVVPPTYQATGSVVLLPPKSVFGDSGNPYLSLGGLGAAVSILSLSMADAETVASLHNEGATGTYSVTADQASAGPVMLVISKAKTPSDTLRTLQLVMAKIPSNLKQVQRSVGTSSPDMITVSVITADKTATRVLKGQIRALMVAGAGGLALTLFAGVVVDAWFVRRRRRRVDALKARDSRLEVPISFDGEPTTAVSGD